MIGSGMGTSGGLGYSGIYGQQPWQEEARKKLYSESFMRGLSMQNVYPASATAGQKLYASNYASSFLPIGATLGGGATSTGRLFPSAGTNVPSSLGGRGSEFQSDWFREMPQYQFPMMG